MVRFVSSLYSRAARRYGHHQARPHRLQVGERGISLVEVVVAVVIIMIAMGGLGVALGDSAIGARAQLERQRALDLADELISRARDVGSMSELGYAAEDPLGTGGTPASKAWRAYCPFDKLSTSEPNAAPTATAACEAAPATPSSSTEQRMIMLPAKTLKEEPEDGGTDPRRSVYEPTQGTLSQAGLTAYVYIYWNNPVRRRFKVVTVVVNYMGDKPLPNDRLGSEEDRATATVKDTAVIAGIPGMSQISQP